MQPFYKCEQEIEYDGLMCTVCVWYRIEDEGIKLIEVFEGGDDILPDLSNAKQRKLIKNVREAIIMGVLPGIGGI